MVDTDKKDIPISKEEQEVGDAVKFVIACLFLALLMYWSWNFVGPSGQTTNLGSFLLLWLREIIFLGLLGVVLIAAGIAWLLQRISKKFLKKENDL